MDGYIEAFLIKYGHKNPTKPQILPHRNRNIQYSNKSQLTPAPDSRPLFDDEDIKLIQGIVGTLLYYGRTVDNKLLVGLSSLGIQQAATTNLTNTTAKQLLDCISTYPNDGITYHASDMILAAHSDAGFKNKTKARMRDWFHILLLENNPFPRYNVPILIINQIIKFLMTSAAEAELGGLYITEKEMVPLHQRLIKMGCPQPPSPV